MTDARPPRPPRPREQWALLPPAVAAAALGVLDAAFERRPPFEGIPFSRYDLALTQVPPPPGLTRDEVRRAIFEELNLLPWSPGLEPSDGGSWLRHSPVAIGADRAAPIRLIPRDPYRLTRKAVRRMLEAMRADGTLGEGAKVDLVEELQLWRDTWRPERTSPRVSLWVRAAFERLPVVHCDLKIHHEDQPPLGLHPHDVFLDPERRFIGSDEGAEQALRLAWLYGGALFRALVATVSGIR